MNETKIKIMNETKIKIMNETLIIKLLNYQCLQKFEFYLHFYLILLQVLVKYVCETRIQFSIIFL